METLEKKKKVAGSGRKQKYGEVTINATTRIPKSKKTEFNKLTKEILANWIPIKNETTLQ